MLGCRIVMIAIVYGTGSTVAGAVYGLSAVEIAASRRKAKTVLSIVPAVRLRLERAPVVACEWEARAC